MNWLYSVGAVLLSLGFACTVAQAAAVTFDPQDEQGITLEAGDVIRARGFQFKQLSDNPASLFAGATAGAYASNGSNSLLAANQAAILLTAEDAGRFDLDSLELGGGNLADVASWATELQL